jgi:hypothetical protein
MEKNLLKTGRKHFVIPFCKEEVTKTPTAIEELVC